MLLSLWSARLAVESQSCAVRTTVYNQPVAFLPVLIGERRSIHAKCQWHMKQELRGDTILPPPPLTCVVLAKLGIGRHIEIEEVYTNGKCK